MAYTLPGEPLPFFFTCAMIMSIDSSFAASMNPQVLITAASAPSGVGTTSKLLRRSCAISFSESTVFLTQPMVMTWTFCLLPALMHFPPLRTR
jgi:hypothetical protein